MDLRATYLPPATLQTPLDNFRYLVNDKFNLHLETYADLHSFSVTRLNDFWLTVWKFTGVIASSHPSRALDDDVAIDKFPTFFEGARLNFAENILGGKGVSTAVVNINEENLSHPEEYSWRELEELVRSYADALRSSGLQKGEVVALVGSNCVRSLALLLATTAIGAVFASFATDMGSKLLTERLQLLKPRFLFAETTYLYNGKRHAISRRLDISIQQLQKNDNTEAIIIGSTQDLTSSIVSFDDFLTRGTGVSLKFEQVLFKTPAVIMFSSGTTGTPKGIVHSHGGLVVNARKEYLLHNNIGPQDLVYQYTNIGWTLWNISIHALFTGAGVVLYDGSPFYPSPAEFLKSMFRLKYSSCVLALLWYMDFDGTRITSFGAGPRYYAELQKANVKPKIYARNLHSIVSTGAVLTPALAEWLAEAFGSVCQMSMSGGTEICGSFLHGTRSLPSYPGELAVKGLGMDVAVYSADGKELSDGESGELVCRKPFPNMPAMFWNDPGRKRYYASYFAGFPNVWTHGDFIRVNPETKGIYVLGRSDGVLNPSGVRFGSSEIYNILSGARFCGSIVDAIVVGQQRITPEYSDPAEQVILFVKCTPGIATGTLHVRQSLSVAIREQITRDLSRRHVPAHIFETEVIPYNANGKKLEIQVKAILGAGNAALGKLKLTQEELLQLKWYERFYRIEDLADASAHEISEAKL